jgi:hypothetical protein
VVPPAGDGDARIDTLIIGAAAGAVLGGAVAKGRGAVAGAAIGAALAEDVSSRASRRYVLGNELTFKLAEALRLPPAR